MTLKKNLWIHGASGRMGIAIRAVLQESSHFLYAGGSNRLLANEQGKPEETLTPSLLSQALTNHNVDCICDFSQLEGNALLLNALELTRDKQRAILVGTTGLSGSQIEAWKHFATRTGNSVLIAPNTSIGILLLSRLATEAAKIAKQFGFDIEIIETHHRNKKDAPSGTANFLASNITDEVLALQTQFQRSAPRQLNEVGVHSIRGGGVIGEHEVRIIGESEEIKLSHRAFNRSLFASGALTLCLWLVGMRPGFYTLRDIDLSQLVT